MALAVPMTTPRYTSISAIGNRVTAVTRRTIRRQRASAAASSETCGRRIQTPSPAPSLTRELSQSLRSLGRKPALEPTECFRFGGGDNTLATPTTVVRQKSRACFHVCIVYLGVDRVLSALAPAVFRGQHSRHQRSPLTVGHLPVRFPSNRTS